MNDSDKKEDGQSDAPAEISPDAPAAAFSFQISIKGLDPEPGQLFGKFISELVKDVAGILDLSCLEGITITPEYARELAEFDRGFGASAVLRPTDESFAKGGAMVVHCKRGDEYKCHVFFDGNLAAAALIAEDAETRQMMTAAIVHELAHVHDFGMLCRMMPDVMLKPLPHSLDGWLYKAVNAAWSEYFACYVAARLDEGALGRYVETFLNALTEFPETIRLEIISYRTSNNLDGLMNTVCDRAGLLFKFAGYALGHLSGIEKTLADTHLVAWEQVKQAGFGAAWDGMRDALAAMHCAYPKWTGLDAYRELGDVMVAYLKTRGIELSSPQAEGYRVRIPYTRETMPPGGMEMLALQGIAGLFGQLGGS